MSFLIGFFFDFGRVWKAKIRPKIDFLRGFWDAFLALSFWSLFLMHFDVFFNAQLLKICDFIYIKCIFLRFCVFSTCMKKVCKMGSKKHGF